MTKLIVPPWVHHNGGVIYSLDAHPTEAKLITAGQKSPEALTSFLIVWNLVPIKSSEDGKDENIPKLLMEIEHFAGVNCVRWSPDGKLFAYGSDDKSVSVYEYEGRIKSAGTFGDKRKKAVERYRNSNTLHSHSMEVLGVEWSPDGRYLASASMDSTIIIWNARKLPERIVVLDGKREGHEDSVKGIAWDPIGKYLASQSSDKTLKIWTTDNWKCEKTISEPFKNSAQTTIFSRLAWSAEGQYLFCPGAMNNEGPTAQIIRRKDWDLSRDFVGFRKAVTCVSVCPRLLNYVDSNNASIRVSLVAIGSRDKSLVVFAYPLVKRPLIALTHLFKLSITDITWKDLELGVSSQDGSVKYFVFSQEELGEMLSNGEMGSECEKLYKMCPSQFEAQNGVAGEDPHNDSQFIETAEQLLAKRTAEANKGKALPAAVDPQQNGRLAQAKQKAEMLAETRKEQVTTTINGKKRIQPIFLSSTIDDEPVLPKPAPAPVPKPVEVQPKPMEKPVVTVVNTKGASSPKKRRIETSTDESTGSESSDDEMDTSETETVNTATTAEPKKLDEPTTSRPMMAADFKRPVLRPFTATRITVGEKETILDMPEKRTSFVEHVIGAPGDNISVDNEWKCVGVDASQVSYNRGEVMVWAVLVDLPVATAAANKIITAVGCFDRSIRVFASSSGRLHCCLQLDSSPVRVGVNGGKVFALTQSGKFSSWDIEKRKAILSRVAVSDCVTKDDHLQSISITAYGLPVLNFSNGDVFTYASDLQCWQLTDSPCSLMKLSRTVDSREIGDGHIGRALNRRRRFGPLPNTPIVVRNSLSETQLESWLNCAQSAGSSADFKKFIVSYATLLVNNGSLTKLKELLNRLEGPGGLCGLQKAALRREVESLLKESPSSLPLLAPKKSVI